ncbi:MAG: glycosyltransferase [Chroococcidiopsidaceae cyanobacterium CP_BM_RX_35]|nr:glycosyltransferase [Chroococcidiopsidaceae cyanobacterium CP_BM_RX_35]
MAKNSKISWYTKLEQVAFALAFVLVGIWLFQQLDWIEIGSELLSFRHWGEAIFSLVSTSTQALLSPSIMGLAIALVAVQLYPVAPPVWVRATVVGILILLAMRYVFWRVFVTLNFSDPFNCSLSLLFFAVELLGLTVNLGSLWLMVVTVDRSSEADRLSRAVIEQDYQPSVDVLVPTYNEPVEMLRRTIIGCQALDYANKQVYLLDDKGRPQMRALAEELGCFYLTRPDNRHAKAGNLNNALKQTSGDLIVVFDADFIPTKNFLTRSVGFFQDYRVALVQTPQTFYNGDPIRHNLGLADFTNDQDFFFRKMQLGRDATNTVICCGSCFIIRRRHLEEIGGIPTETLCEDLLTSLQLQAAGYRVLYLNEALSAGAAAEDVGGYIDQRLRWGQGTLQTLLVKTNPLIMPGLNLAQRFFQSLGIFYWLIAGFQAMFMLVPLIYLLFGLTPLVAELNGLIFFWVPYYVVNVSVFAWLNERKRSVFWADVYSNIICFPVALMIMGMFLKPFGKRFKVTPKAISFQGIRVNWTIIYPLITVLGIYLAVLAMYLLGFEWHTQPHLETINFIWSIYNVCMLIVTIQVAVDVPQQVLSLSFPHQLKGELTLNEHQLGVTTATLSQQGTTIKLAPDALPTQFPNNGWLHLPIIGLLNVPVELRNVNSDAAGSIELEWEFTALSLLQERRLIEFLFCQPGQWQETQISETKSFWSLLVAVFRFYPLTRTMGKRRNTSITQKA